MTEDDQRAERAFRDALEARAEDAQPVALDLPMPRRRWRSAAAVAAAAVLVLVAGTAIVGRHLVMERQARAALFASAGSPAPTGPLPAPDAGWRWISFRGVGVQVPDSWGTHPVPTSPCGGPGTGPYASVPDPTIAHSLVSIGCPGRQPGGPAPFGPAPRDAWATHVALSIGPPTVSTATYDGWAYVAREVGGVSVSVMTAPGDEALGARVMASARSITVDQNGCDATSPAQADRPVRPDPPFDVTTIASVTSVSLCEYSRVGTDRAGLTASRRIDGPAADALLHAIQTAPTGGGPDHVNDCSLSDDFGRSSIVIRLETGTGPRDLYMSFEGCVDNGIDDGTAVRALTAADCGPIFAQPPIDLNEGQAAVFEVCRP